MYPRKILHEETGTSSVLGIQTVPPPLFQHLNTLSIGGVCEIPSEKA